MGKEITAPIKSFAIAPTGTAVPTTPAGGANIAWTSATAWTAVTYIDEANIDIEMNNTTVDVDPPTAQGRLSSFQRKNASDTLSATIYGLDVASAQFSSTSALATDTITETTTIAYKAVLVEYDGVAYRHFPKVRLKPPKITAGVNEEAKMEFEGSIYVTTAIPSGEETVYYVDAT